MTDDGDVFGEDCEYITPPVNLRAKVRVMSKREAANFDPVAAAEQALQKLSINFNGWMADETATLLAAWLDISRHGLTQERTDVLFRAAHDIKGQAATLGYPLAATVADSLCRLIEAVPDVRRIPDILIEQHIQAVRAIVAEDARDEKDKTGQALSTRLTRVTEDFIHSVVPPDTH